MPFLARHFIAGREKRGGALQHLLVVAHAVDEKIALNFATQQEALFQTPGIIGAREMPQADEQPGRQEKSYPGQQAAPEQAAEPGRQL